MPQINRVKPRSLFCKKPDAPKGEIKKKRWNIGALVLKVLKRTCMAVGAMVLLSSITSFILLSSAMKNTTPSLPEEMVLVLKLDQGVAERADQAGLTDLFPAERPTIRQVIDTLNAAARDERVKAVVFNLKSGGFTLNHITEMRDALMRFRESGKRAYFYTSSFADSGGGIGGYYLATAFDEIWMQPVGLLSISGFGVEVPLLKNTLSKIGVNAQFLQREEYKSAMETFTDSELTAESRETLSGIMREYSNQVIDGIAQSRDLPRGQIIGYMGKAILDGDRALASGLIDHLDYGDVLVSKIRKTIKGDPDDEDLDLVSFNFYGSTADGAARMFKNDAVKKENIAMIYVAGAIVPDGAANVAAADVIAPAIQSAIDDETINTILLRVDSPGGSPSASETIRRMIVKAKEKDKRVIVSMGNLAASGGYWVSADADIIFASPSTLTGSIGVVMGKFELSALWDKLGANWEPVNAVGDFDLWSMNKPFSPAQLSHLNTIIDATYDAFLERVASGRNMSIDDVRKVAKGRVWTGAAAKERGLVDRIGGLYDALTYIAVEEHGLVSADDLNIVVLPKPKTRFEQFFELLDSQGQFAKVAASVQGWMTSYDRVQNPQHYLVYDADLDLLK